MRAAVLEAFGAPLVVQEVELADPRPGEVLVRLVACGVCHTDLYTASGAGGGGSDLGLSHRLTLDGVNRGFELMYARDGIRSVIEF